MGSEHITSAEAVNAAARIKVVAATSDNYAPVFDRFRASLRPFDDGIELLVHSIDMSPYGSHHAFRTDSWYAAVREKMAHLLRVLTSSSTAEGEYVVFTDADIIFYAPHKLPDLVREASERGLEYFGMREGVTREYNTGFMVLRNTERVRELVQEVVARLTGGERPSLGDQSIINERIGASGVAHAHIDTKHTLWGDGTPTADTVLHHAVCCMNVSEKLAQMDRVRSRR